MPTATDRDPDASARRARGGQVLHGRLIGGLTARAVERARAEDPGPDLHAADHRHVPVRARWPRCGSAPGPVRSGRRIAVLEVTVEQDGRPDRARARSCCCAGPSSRPGSSPRRRPAWAAPAPGPQLGAGASRHGLGQGWTGPQRAAGGPRRTSRGGQDGPSGRDDGRRTCGSGTVYPLVSRRGADADWCGVGAGRGPLRAGRPNYLRTAGCSFINADYTVYLGREPAGRVRRPAAATGTSASGAWPPARPWRTMWRARSASSPPPPWPIRSKRGS